VRGFSGQLNQIV